MKGTVAVNEAGAYLDCGLKGFGLIQTPRYMALPHLQSGELIEVLPQCKPGAVPMSILYPQSRQLSPRCAPSPTGWPSCSPAARC